MLHLYTPHCIHHCAVIGKKKNCPFFVCVSVLFHLFFLRSCLLCWKVTYIRILSYSHSKGIKTWQQNVSHILPPCCCDQRCALCQQFSLILELKRNRLSGRLPASSHCPPLLCKKHYSHSMSFRCFCVPCVWWYTVVAGSAAGSGQLNVAHLLVQ